MKLKLVFVILTVSGMLAFAACNNAPKTEQKQTEQTKKAEYTCPMHPEIVQDKPGKCPKCGMDLIEKKDEVKK